MRDGLAVHTPNMSRKRSRAPKNMLGMAPHQTMCFG
jgi:hypothetical protein